MSEHKHRKKSHRKHSTDGQNEQHNESVKEVKIDQSSVNKNESVSDEKSSQKSEQYKVDPPPQIKITPLEIDPTKREVLPPSKQKDSIDTSNWPLLLKNYSNMYCKTGFFTPFPCGNSPLKRPISEYLKYGVILLDKPCKPSSHEVVSWVKRLLQVEKTGHSGTLDPRVTGCLVICLNRATRIAKSQQSAGKEYVAVLRLFGDVELEDIQKALKTLTGKVYQCPPAISNVKKELRVRFIEKNEFIEYDRENHLVVFRCSCEAGTFIRVLCEHLGYVLGVGGEMAELRRTRSGNNLETNGLVSMFDVLDSKFMLDKYGDERYIRRVVRPLEWMLTHYKRIVVKDSSVDAICHGAKVLIPGIMRFDYGIEVEELIIIITTKGEAIAMGIAQMTSEIMMTANHGVASKIKRVIMDRGTYIKGWGTGPVATEKKRMIQAGLLTDKGKPNEKTPPHWLKNYLERDLAANK